MRLFELVKAQPKLLKLVLLHGSHSLILAKPEQKPRIITLSLNKSKKKKKNSTSDMLLI